MRQKIPTPLIAVLSAVMPDAETHASLDSLFLYAEAPGDPPDGSKPQKVQEWLRRVNKDESVNPLDVLGNLIGGYMEYDELDPYAARKRIAKEKIEAILDRCGLQYVRGNRVIGATGTPSSTLKDIVKARDLASIHEEFDRSLRNVESSPREAVSAASNILESVCKTYIVDEGLEMPKKQDLQPVWNVVRKDLGFDPGSIEDRDLQEILSGLIAVVNGIGALRTHCSSAHGAGRSRYRLQPRHARLTIHAAHTITAFIIESWDKKRGETG
jgi:hypothetical protein